MKLFLSRIPTFVLFLVALGAIYNIASKLEIINYLREYRVKYEDQQALNIYIYIGTVKILEQTGNEQAIYSYLDQAVEGRHFDFYFLWNQNQTLRSNDPWASMGPLDQYSPTVDQLMSDPEENIIYASTKVGENILTIGFRLVDKIRFFDRSLQSHARHTDSNNILVVFLVAIIGFFFFREIYQLISALKSPDRLGSKKIKPKSTEADLLLRGLSLYERQIEDLSKENQTLNEHLLPALKRELSSGREPPYSFDCTLVRTDINDFSTMFNRSDREKFMESIHDFFVLISHTISRYGGYVYEFIGDEVIYYFKDEEHENSALAAVSCIRTIHQEADLFSDHTKTEIGCPWIVKSSVAHGSLRFGRLVNGHSLAGGILIETVRILSHIHEKASHTIYYGKEVATRIEPLCTGELEQEVVLRGVPGGSRPLYSYRSHRPLLELLKEKRESSLHSLVVFYRSNADIREMFEFLKKNERQIEDSLFFSIILVFRSVKLKQSVLEFKEGYQMLLQELLSHLPKAEDPSNLIKRLTALVGCADHLLTAENLDPELNATHRQVLAIDSPRLTATLIEQDVLVDSLNAPISYRHFHSTGNGRLLSNLLIRHGKIEITGRVIREIWFMLKNKDPLFVASGLYAVGMIGTHYRHHNPIYLAAHRRFQDIILKLPSFIAHSHDSISHQALQAIKAIQSEDQMGFLRSLYHATSDEKLKSKIDQHFDLLGLKESA